MVPRIQQTCWCMPGAGAMGLCQVAAGAVKQDCNSDMTALMYSGSGDGEDRRGVAA